MDILVVGSGGREHAIVWKLSQSRYVNKIYCAPGNAGISQLADCVPIQAIDIENLVRFAKEKKVDITIVGMDDPLMLGIVNEFEKEGLRIFGPTKEAAIIEGSKSFSKDFMKRYNIPTAEYEVFTDPNEAKKYLEINNKFPIVIKADGLALGKGVLICNNHNEAIEAVDSIMIDKKFGEAGNKLVVEEYIEGHEVSVLAFCDGDTVVPMVSAQDHKRALDGDKGLNTGGMGTFSPSKHYTEEIHNFCIEKIFIPTIKGMKEEGREFKGILFFGLMLTDDGPKVLEYNARFGDPEAQVVLPRLDTDLLKIISACVDGNLDKIDIKWKESASVCVILASGGYPLDYEKGYEIKGLDKISDKENIIVFHAGTKYDHDKIVTNGGRVLGITALGENLDTAIDLAYLSVRDLYFNNMQYRKDIGKK